MNYSEYQISLRVIKMLCNGFKETNFLSRVPYYFNNFPLPRELMIKIFEYYVNLTGEGPIQADTLGKVCESWRQLVLDSRSIWQRARVILVSKNILTLPVVEAFRRETRYRSEVKVFKMDDDSIDKLIKLGVVFKFLDPHSGLELVKINYAEETFNLIMIRPNPDWFKEKLTKQIHNIDALEIKYLNKLEYPLFNKKIVSNLTVLELYCRPFLRSMDFSLLMKNTPNLIKFDCQGYINVPENTLRYYLDNPQEHGGWKKLQHLSLEGVGGFGATVNFVSGGGNRLTHLKLSFSDYIFLHERIWMRRKIKALHLKKIKGNKVFEPDISLLIEQWSDSLESLHLYGFDDDQKTLCLNLISQRRLDKTIKELKMDVKQCQPLFTLYNKVQLLCHRNRNFSP